MKTLYEYDSWLFFGGGIMAERLFDQLDNVKQRLIGVFDLLDGCRKISRFKDYQIKSVCDVMDDILNDDTAIIVAIGSVNVAELVSQMIKKTGVKKEKVFVVNPYTTLRFSCVDEDSSRERRIPFEDDRYKIVESLFRDYESKKLYEMLISSKTYDDKTDNYELVNLADMGNLYYCAEDYWNSFDFSSFSSKETATVLDCGAYIGDSILNICHSIPEKDIIYYAFEPLKENAEQILNNKEFLKTCRVLKTYECGVGECDKRLYFRLPPNGELDGGKFVEAQGDAAENALQICRIDGMDLYVEGNVYIKMDIEGAELGALKGAREFLIKNRPCLAICLYHRKNDLLEIPIYLHSILKDYDFFLRGGYHTILWAIPQ